MLTKRVRSCVRSQGLPVHCCGRMFDLCHSPSAAKVLWVKKGKKRKKKKGNGRALRGELLCMDGWSSSWPSSLIGWRYISRTPPVHLKENTASVHTMMHSVWSGVQFDLRAKMEVSGKDWWRKNCGNSAVSPTTPWIHKAKQKPFFERRAWLHLTFNW